MEAEWKPKWSEIFSQFLAWSAVFLQIYAVILQDVSTLVDIMHWSKFCSLAPQVK